MNYTRIITGHKIKLTINKSLVFLVLLATLAFSHPVHATIISYNFSGHINYISDNYNLIGNSIISGDSFNGSFSYDTEGTKSPYLNDPTVAIYYASLGSSVNISKYTFDYNVGNYGPDYVQVWDNRDIGIGQITDSFSYTSPLSYNPPIQDSFGSMFSQMSVMLFDNSHTVNSDLSIPSSLDLSSYNARMFSVTGVTQLSAQTYYLSGNIETLIQEHESAPVPEPSTILLFGAGLAGLAFYRKRKLA